MPDPTSAPAGPSAFRASTPLNPTAGESRLTPRNSIQRLPRPTSHHLRSSTVIPSVSSILSELVQNSLDAESTSIEIWLDLTQGEESLRVEDDGQGIDREGLKLLGMSGTSGKVMAVSPAAGMSMSALESFGFRGEALSSIAALSLLEVISKTSSDSNANMKVMKSGKTVYLGDPPVSRTVIRTHGTTVIVKDLFHSIPVRRKNLLSTSSTSTLSACRKVVETLALVRPNVKWTLWEQCEMGTSTGHTKRILSLRGGKTSADVFRAIYGSASVERVQKIRVSSGERRVEGFISLGSGVTRSHQRLYVNSYPIDRCELHHAIDKRFAQSRFSAMTADDQEFEPASNRLRRSPRRLERYPVYVLNVMVPAQDIDNAFGPRKTFLGFRDSSSVKALLLAVVDDFLRRHDFLYPKAAKAPLHIQSPSHPFAATPTKAKGKRGPLFASDRASPQPGSTVEAARRCTPDDAIVNSRLDLQVAKRSCGSTTRERPSKRQKLLEQALPMVADRSSPVPPQWIEDLIHRNSPQVYGYPSPWDQDDTRTRYTHLLEHHSAHNRIPTSSMPLKDVTFSEESLKHATVLGQVDLKFIACILSGQRTGTQGDHRVLVMVDQHAADERASVEPILRELCRGFVDDTIETTESKVPPVVILSREEADIVLRPDCLEILDRWGIKLQLPKEATAQVKNGAEPNTRAKDYAQIQVRAVPTSLVSRLGRKEAVEMTRLLRLYIPFLEEHSEGIQASLRSGREPPPEGEGDGRDWQEVLRWMPKEMLELANSKACRGAIMFQDPLDLDQCQRLLHRLSETKNPFICAHGRPSLVPLTLLDGTIPAVKREIDWKAFASRQ